MDNRLCGTGRTMRMLRSARGFCREGRAVYVVGYTEDNARALSGIYNTHFADTAQDLDVHFISWTDPRFDPRYLRMFDRPFAVVLVDHAALERAYGEMLHMYDLPPGEENRLLRQGVSSHG